MEAQQRIIDLLEHQKGERLVWNGYLPNGKKRQIWQDQDINWDLHFFKIYKFSCILLFLNFFMLVMLSFLTVIKVKYSGKILQSLSLINLIDKS